MLSFHQNAVKIKERQLEKLNLDEWIMEEKFKGIRVWLIKEFGHYRLVTRGGEDVTVKFPHITEMDWVPSLQSVQLDCELYDPFQQDEIVSGWAMTLPENLDPDVVSKCVLKCFDVVYINGTSLALTPQELRKEAIKQLNLRGPIQKVQWYPANDHRKYYEYILAQGGEGIMLKNRLAPYYEGKRTVKAWFKRKKRDQYDVVILGFTSGKGKFENLIGAIEVGQYVDGHLRKICNVSGMSDSQRSDFTFYGSSYIGRVISCWAMEQDSNSYALIEPSFSHFRIDKRPEDCIPLL